MASYVWFNTEWQKKKRLPRLKVPIIIYNKGTRTVLIHPRNIGVSFRGLWYKGNYFTTAPYGKCHGAIGRKVCKLTRRTVHLIDKYSPRRFIGVRDENNHF